MGDNVYKSLQNTPNMLEYDSFCSQFSWENEYDNFEGLPGGGINIAHETVDRHANGHLRNIVALRWIQKDSSFKDFTYTDLKVQTSRFANVLEKLGVKKGDTVFSLTGRIPALYFSALGTLKSRAIFCPMFSVFGPEPCFQRLNKGKAKVLVTTKKLYEKKIKSLLNRLPLLQYILLTDVEQDIDKIALSLSKLMGEVSDDYVIKNTKPEDPALLHFTSGTTGMPKGALHVHKAVLTHYVTGKYVLDLHPGDIFWCTADPGWVTGTSYGIIAPLVNGVTNIIDEEEFNAKRWYSILEEHSVNVWYTAPTAIRRLMRIDFNPLEKYDLSRLRVIHSVGEPLQPKEVIWGQNTFKIPICDNWWQTETGGIMISNYVSIKVKPGSMGKPLPGIEAAIGEIEGEKIRLLTKPGEQGHLLLRSGWPSMFRTYLDEEERYQKCFKGEWYITGDLARKDADGYFWFVGRADDIIKTSGHMVGPFEVESALMEHLAVAEAAIIGKPDPIIGELVKAFIVLKPGVEANEQARLDIKGFLRKKLGPAVAPKEIAFIESLPKTKSGKILRRLLKARELGLPEGDTSTLE
ncbi:acetate--CoA ligase [Aquimarina celericrescens]|uniref:acetate--CoA ligase n=1 Tax=Aquimarina celericrescens TaxID=1964542 RepID=A0ABW5AUX9_9FLAO|nr:acetate--CoA ligase [Aquimarina celericrescens]